MINYPILGTGKTNPIKANFPYPKARLGVGQAVARSGKVCTRLGDPLFQPLHRIVDGFGVLFNFGLCGGQLSLLESLGLYTGERTKADWGLGFIDRTGSFELMGPLKERKAFVNMLKKLISAFVDSITLEEAVYGSLQAEELGAPTLSIGGGISRKYMKPYLVIRFPPNKKSSSIITMHFSDIEHGQDLKGMLSIKIEKRWSQAMTWLEYGLSSTEACEEAWWNCLWLAAEPAVKAMVAIKKCVGNDAPLTDEQRSMLGKYMRFGMPTSLWDSDENGKQTFTIFTQPQSCNPEYLTTRWRGRPMEFAIIALLCQPAFDIAKELEEKHSQPRFQRQCRAPSCGKSFWTGHNNATNCPGSQGGRKNRCALEWIRYKRYLDKIGKDPEKDWDNEQLKKNFISYNKS